MRKIFTLFFLPVLLMGCAAPVQPVSEEQRNQFGVYLTENNQLIFSEDDIDSYSPKNQTFILTAEAAARMKSYQTSTEIGAGLFQKAFSAKLGEKTIYEGKFWSNLSSQSENGIIISDVLMVSPEYPTITVAASYPSKDISPDNNALINHPELLRHLRVISKIDDESGEDE